MPLLFCSLESTHVPVFWGIISFKKFIYLFTLFLPLSQDCRLARIWLSIAVTQESLSSRLCASKCHIWPVEETIIKSAFSSSVSTRKQIQLLVTCAQIGHGYSGIICGDLSKTNTKWLKVWEVKNERCRGYLDEHMLGMVGMERLCTLMCYLSY